mgnify:CR=1 FL=1
MKMRAEGSDIRGVYQSLRINAKAMALLFGRFIIVKHSVCNLFGKAGDVVIVVVAVGRGIELCS